MFDLITRISFSIDTRCCRSSAVVFDATSNPNAVSSPSPSAPQMSSDSSPTPPGAAAEAGVSALIL